MRHLPAGFEDLEPFADDWCLERGSERYRKRLATSMESIQRYYDAMLPRMPAVSEHLNGFSMDDLPAAETRLLWMALSFMECAMSVELYRTPDVPGGYPSGRMIVEP